MKSSKPGIFVGVVGFCVGGFGLESVWLFREWRGAESAAVNVEQKLREWDRLVSQSPIPSENTLTILREEVASLSEELGQQQGGWRIPREESVNPGTRTPVDSLIALSHLRARLRLLAAERGVLLGSDEQFGFEAFAQVGPPPGMVADVQRQQAEVEFLIETLLASAPRTLLGVKIETRESPTDLAPSGRGDRSLTVSEQRSMRQAGLIATDVMQVEFTGVTATLRRFLNTLAVSERPVCVRGVEVGPVAEALAEYGLGEGPRMEDFGARTVLFTVVVEFPRTAQGGGG